MILTSCAPRVAYARAEGNPPFSLLPAQAQAQWQTPHPKSPPNQAVRTRGLYGDSKLPML